MPGRGSMPMLEIRGGFQNVLAVFLVMYLLLLTRSEENSILYKDSLPGGQSLHLSASSVHFDSLEQCQSSQLEFSCLSVERVEIGLSQLLSLTLRSFAGLELNHVGLSRTGNQVTRIPLMRKSQDNRVVARDEDWKAVVPLPSGFCEGRLHEGRDDTLVVLNPKNSLDVHLQIRLIKAAPSDDPPPDHTCMGIPADDPRVCSGHGECTWQDNCDCFGDGYFWDEESPDPSEEDDTNREHEWISEDCVLTDGYVPHSAVVFLLCLTGVPFGIALLVFLPCLLVCVIRCFRNGGQGKRGGGRRRRGEEEYYPEQRKRKKKIPCCFWCGLICCVAFLIPFAVFGVIIQRSEHHDAFGGVSWAWLDNIFG